MLHCDISKGYGDNEGRVVVFFWKDEEALEIEFSFTPEEAETLSVNILRMAKRVAADSNKGD